MRMMTPVADIQDQESLSRKTAERETPESRSVEVNEPSPVKRLDGEVTRLGDFPFAEGNYCEVWIGLWEKVGSKEVGSEKVNADKLVRASPLLSY
jgi:hypothetical protein